MTTSSNRMPMAWTRRDATAMFQRMVEERHREMGRTIARLRMAKGWTQPDLAYEAKVSVGTISRLENGKHEGRGGTIRAVAKALDVTAQDLLPGAEPDPGELSQLDRIEDMLSRVLEILDAPREIPELSDESVERLATAVTDRARRAQANR